MKKIVLSAALGCLVVTAGTAIAQESRQDVSISATAVLSPNIVGSAGANSLNPTTVLGGLVSYRFLLTPRSGLEANYGYTENSNRLYANFITARDANGNFIPARVHARQQEISVAYVYSRNYRNFNPFVEAGGGIMLFTPIRDGGTTEFDAAQNSSPGGLFGAGVAYELSPSFDLRVGYRGFIVKSPNFKLSQPGNNFTTNRYEVISTPSVGIAFHF